MTRTLTADLESALAAGPRGALVVGYSGGLDSSVLLHLLATSAAARARGLRAVHVDHALQADSTQWAAHCAAFAAALDVPLDVIRVHVARERGLGLEAAAREARYAAFESALAPGEVLVLAHHRDDQAETVLLRLLRGAGPEGLAAMRTSRAFGTATLWRPLLAQTRSTLRTYARQHDLTWIDDPSNAAPDLARSFLRSDVLPRLRTHWPRLDEALLHAATHARHAADFIDAHAAHALAQVQGLDPATLHWARWLALPPALRDPVLRSWLRACGLAEPAHYHVAELEKQLAQAGADKLPCVSWAGGELRRYRDLLYARVPCADPPAGWEATWDGAPLTLPAGCGRIAGAGAPTGDALTVRFRRGGERLRRTGQAQHRELRDLFQEAGVPPWERGRIPLLWHGRELAAVGDLWLAEAGARWQRETGCVWQWVPHHLHDADAPAD